MTLTVKLFAGFRVGRFKERVVACSESTSIADLLAALKIPQAELGVLMINGRHAQLGQALNEGDSISIFPLVGGG